MCPKLGHILIAILKMPVDPMGIFRLTISLGYMPLVQLNRVVRYIL